MSQSSAEPRKTTAKKTAAKKTAAKRATAKKAVPPKAVAQKAVQPKAVAQTAVAQEAVAQTAAAQRPAPRTTVRKTVSKKAPAAAVSQPQPVSEPVAVDVPQVASPAGAPQYVLIDPVWLERAYRLGVGSAVIAAASGGKVLGVPGGPLAEGLPADDVIDFGVGVSDSVFSAVQRGVNALSRAVAPVMDVVRPSLQHLADRVAEVLAPAIEPVAERGRRRRAEAEAEMASLIESLIPDITDLMLERIDLQTVLSRIDVQELVEASIDHIDMQALMSKMDMSQTVDHMMSELDLTQIALDHVDMNRVMENAIKQVDMVALVRSQLEGMDLAELLIGTPTSLASGALRQTSRLVRRG